MQQVAQLDEARRRDLHIMVKKSLETAERGRRWRNSTARGKIGRHKGKTSH